MHFTEEQLQELETVFGLTRTGETLPVKDGVVRKDTLVWWRGNDGPDQVVARKDWENIRAYPELYSLKRPKIKYVD